MRFIIAAFVLALMGVSAQADACRDKITAMFDSGPLDPFVRTPHSLTNTVTNENGEFVRRYLTRWQTPFRTVSGIEGSPTFALVIDQESWIGPSLDGPWTKAPNALPDDHNEVRRQQHAQERANLTDTECPGETVLDGTPYDVVVYTTKTDPNPQMNDAWFGARHTVYIDTTTNLVMRWESTDFVSSFAPDLSKDLQVQEFEYDADLVVSKPE